MEKDETTPAAPSAPSQDSAPNAFVRRPRSRRTIALICTGAAFAFAVTGGGTAIGIIAAENTVGTLHAAATASSGRITTIPAQRFTPYRGGSASAAPTATAATAEQERGVVTILTTIDYDSNEQAAGTGTIMTSDGLILTNNHVIEGATSIQVTDESTGAAYTASVVGTDATDDVAVLQLAGASGLTAADYGASNIVATGDSVTAIGNAGGTGDLVSAAGSVADIDQSITVQGDEIDAGETLGDLIEVTADIVAGDSGGPLLDSDGEVVGMDTAASSGTNQVIGYAIPIDDALTIARQIESGVPTTTVRIGLPAFLGVEFSQSTAGATIAGVLSGSPAAEAGITAGDSITAIGSTPVSTAADLSAAIAASQPGAVTSVTWTDDSGASHQASVTLASGPAL